MFPLCAPTRLVGDSTYDQSFPLVPRQVEVKRKMVLLTIQLGVCVGGQHLYHESILVIDISHAHAARFRLTVYLHDNRIIWRITDNHTR